MKQSSTSLPAWKPHWPFLLLLVVNLIIGLIVFDDYGMSWDEPLNHQYARDSVEAYVQWADQDFEIGLGPSDQRFKGAGYFIPAQILVDGLNAIDPPWLEPDSWHLVQFLYFVAGLGFFYLLACRFTSPRYAFLAVLLFNTQPLIWGHALINPKDMPFTVYFLGAVALGFRWVDRAAEGSSRVVSRPRLLLTLMIVMLLFAGLLIFAQAQLFDLVMETIHTLYQASPPSFLWRLFKLVAPNATGIPLNAYLTKAEILFIQLYPLLLGLSLLGASAAAAGRSGLSRISLAKLALAALLVGLAAAVRVLGPAAGILVAIFMLVRLRSRSVWSLLAYTLFAITVMFFFWPFLWSAPLDNLMASIFSNAEFAWQGSVMYWGGYYSTDNLPWHYLPVLISIQFTLPALALSLSGFFFSFKEFFVKKSRSIDLVLIAVWFWLPFMGVVFFRPNMYDNFRHFLFITPPLFLFTAITFSRLKSRIANGWLFSVLSILLILPGLVSVVSLHPYQYVYYNQLAGGLPGAEGQFELDYWITSFREAAEHLNAEAPPDADVRVEGMRETVIAFVRPDLVSPPEQGYDLWDVDGPYFGIYTSRFYYNDLDFLNDSAVVYQVERQGVIYAVVKRLK